MERKILEKSKHRKLIEEIESEAKAKLCKLKASRERNCALVLVMLFTFPPIATSKFYSNKFQSKKIHKNCFRMKEKNQLHTCELVKWGIMKPRKNL